MHRRVVIRLSFAHAVLPIVAGIVCLSGCTQSAAPSQTSHTTQVLPGVEVPPPPDDSDAMLKELEVIEGSGGAADGEAVATKVSKKNPPPARPPIRRAGTGDTTDITFDDLKLDMPVGTLFDRSMLTPRVEGLDGQNVRLRGFIFAGGVFQSSGIKSFPFVMNTQCKFGPQGLAYCVILVELVDGVTTDFTTYPITVEGKLSVQPFNDSGFTWSVYHLRGTKAY